MRWGENLGAPRAQPPLAVSSAPDLSRAVRVASTEDYPNRRCISGKALDQAIRTAGSNPARSHPWRWLCPGRAEIFALPPSVDPFSSSAIAPVVFNQRIVVFLQIRSNQSNPFGIA
jgi:hypothetical protein